MSRLLYSQRRRILIDRFQAWLVGIELFHFVLVGAIFLATLFMPLVVELYSGDISSPEVQEAAEQFLYLHYRIWLPLILAVALFSLHNVLMSHRIAGPLYRLRRFLKEVGEGDLSQRIRLRSKDRLTEEADVANAMVAALDERVRRLSAELAEARAVWSEIQSDGTVDPAKAERISAFIRAWEETLGEFKTRPATADPERAAALLRDESSQPV